MTVGPSSHDRIGERRRLTAEALADPTRFAILELLEGADDPMDVMAITEAVGVHHTAIRSHLAKLRDVGLVHEEHAPPEGRGRPKLLYAAVAGSPPRAVREPYRELSSMLARTLREGRSSLEVGEEAGREVARRRDPAETMDTVDLIEAEAQELGFDPRRQVRSDRTDLVLQHCPFQDVAVEDPDTICSLHLGIARGIASHKGDVEVLGMVVKDPRRAGCRLQLQRIGLPEVPVDPPTERH